MSLDNMTIAEFKQISAMLNGTGNKQTKIADGDHRIVVLQRGWVAVGNLYQEGDICRLENAQIIRSWGTSNGLGELINGPKTSTKLDPAGVLHFHQYGIVCTFKTDEKKWK